MTGPSSRSVAIGIVAIAVAVAMAGAIYLGISYANA